jgi:hypothetical protein
MGEKKMCAKFWLEDLEVLGIGGRVILEWILEKLGGNMWTGFIWQVLVNLLMNLWVP